MAWLTTPGALADGPVEIIETACAQVLLAGDRAYKLKRAIRYDYLDFGTLEKRNAAVRAEIELNRRTAPELYLGVLPVFADDAGFRLGDLIDAAETDPEAAEHLIVMRRFDATATLDRLADSGTLEGDVVDRLADAIAAFHDAADPKPFEGAADRLKRVSARTMAEITGQPEVVGEAAAFGLDRAMRAALDAAAPEVEARGRAGLIRRLHGDLHLGNVALIDGRPVIFDALEFDDGMATVDLLHDLAFLVMDLWARGRPEFAARAWSRYLARRDDYAGQALAPLYVAMRAAVRAKVALNAGLLADGDARAAKQDEARLYVDAATRALERPKPRLVAIGGLSGTGKTTLARAAAPLLAPAVGAVHLRSDVLRKRLQGGRFEEKLPKEAYTPEASAAVYLGLLDRAAACLAEGAPVIVDAVFARPEERQAVADLARRLGVPFDGVWLDLDLGRRQSRIADRTGDASDATPDVAARQADYELGEIDWTRIEANDHALDAVKARLGV
ncbi:MAG: AAA family ATPase [Alphaproteobacteria bacterium]